MFKKVLISAVIVTAVFAAGSAVYAQSEYSGVRKDVAPVFELISDKTEAKTFESEYVISARAKEGTVITMQLYWYDEGDSKSILAKKKIASEDSEKQGIWLLQDTDEWTVGSSGLIAKTVTLNFGKNKITLNVKDVNGNAALKIIEIELNDKAQASEDINGDAINKLLNDMGVDKNKQ